MARMGSLARVALSEVLKAIALNEFSGALEVSSGRVVRTMYFDRGFVVFTASNSEADRLANCLLDAGKITEEDFEAASRLVVEGKRRIGAALVELGLLTELDLERELANQARQIACSIFATPAGMYRFDEQPCPVPDELRQSLSIYRIQLEGIREMYNEALVSSALPPLETPVRLAHVAPFTFEDVRFLPEELLVMEATQKERAIEAILERITKPKDVVLRAVYGLLSSGVLELLSQSPRLPQVPETVNDLDLSTPGQDDAPGPDDALRKEVLSAYERAERASPTELLDVASEADEVDIRRAHAKKQSEWESRLPELGGDETLLAMVEDIRRRLEGAKETLLSGLAGEDTGEEEAPRRAPVASFRSVEDKDEVKRLLKEIKLRRMVHDTEGVISFLYKITKLAPDNPKFEAMLAQALGSHPVLKKKAESHFRKALALDPQNATLHYLFGRYYQSFDMKSRALAEFKTALKIDPGLSKARTALVELKGGDDGSLQGKIKQIFG